MGVSAHTLPYLREKATGRIHRAVEPVAGRLTPVCETDASDLVVIAAVPEDVEETCLCDMPRCFPRWPSDRMEECE